MINNFYIAAKKAIQELNFIVCKPWKGHEVLVPPTNEDLLGEMMSVRSLFYVLSQAQSEH